MVLIAWTFLVPIPQNCRKSKAKLGLDHSFQGLESLSVEKVTHEINNHIIMNN